jgi:hypothetical protein
MAAGVWGKTPFFAKPDCGNVPVPGNNFRFLNPDKLERIGR